MQFKKVKDVEEKNKVIAEFLANRKILRQRLIDEKLGKQKLAIAAELAQRPVTAAVEKAQKQTDEKQDKVIEQLQEKQDKITEAVDTLSEAVSKSGSTMPVDVGAYLKEKVPDPAFQSDLSSLSLADETRIKALGFDETFVNIPSSEEIQTKIDELTRKLSTAKDKGAKIKSLKTYKALIDKRNQPSTSQPKKTIKDYFSAQKKTGTSLKPRPNILKLSPNGTFGNLIIDPDKLVGGRLVVFDKKK